VQPLPVCVACNGSYSESLLPAYDDPLTHKLDISKDYGWHSGRRVVKIIVHKLIRWGGLELEGKESEVVAMVNTVY